VDQISMAGGKVLNDGASVHYFPEVGARAITNWDGLVAFTPERQAQTKDARDATRLVAVVPVDEQQQFE
jgi:hypothetical protein